MPEHISLARPIDQIIQISCPSPEHIVERCIASSKAFPCDDNVVQSNETQTISSDDDFHCNNLVGMYA